MKSVCGSLCDKCQIAFEEMKLMDMVATEAMEKFSIEKVIYASSGSIHTTQGLTDMQDIAQYIKKEVSLASSPRILC